jgi:hypothetical protein
MQHGKMLFYNTEFAFINISRPFCIEKVTHQNDVLEEKFLSHTMDKK